MLAIRLFLSNSSDIAFAGSRQLQKTSSHHLTEMLQEEMLQNHKDIRHTEDGGRVGLVCTKQIYEKRLRQNAILDKNDPGSSPFLQCRRSLSAATGATLPATMGALPSSSSPPFHPARCARRRP
uniref:Uncharacterized protein n=1 Tax=Oryza sativa subsp. japonica TaxID=39947 RepID=Q7EZK9_ORYSJ|nr:hypothetical protein [Oryza sativa Japonica Group]BAD12943.1 hypothetical protein [Oryza sativa Japonica Group]